MAGKPTGPPPSERSAARARAARLAAEEEPREHYGPVVVARHSKDDGRSLILYSHPRGEPQ